MICYNGDIRQFAIVPSSWGVALIFHSLMVRVCYVTFCVYRKPTPAYRSCQALA